MAAIIQSFSHLFLKLAALEISLNSRAYQRFTDGLANLSFSGQSLAFSDRFFHHLPRSR
jgi:hypothetical protein